jgi:hypothetical protein
MSSSTVIEHAEKIGVGAYPLFGAGAMLDGVDSLNASWFYTWARQLPPVEIAGWLIGSAAKTGGVAGDRDLYLGSGADGWAVQDIVITGQQSLTLSFTATGSGQGGVVLNYLDPVGNVIGTDVQAVGVAGGSFEVHGITPAGATTARLIAYANEGDGLTY